MIIYPAVIVHGMADAQAALALGLPVTLLSAPAAAQFAGCLWWREVVAGARLRHPDTAATDILDCADASGVALGALRCGVLRLVLWPAAPGTRREHRGNAGWLRSAAGAPRAGPGKAKRAAGAAWMAGRRGHPGG